MSDPEMYLHGRIEELKSYLAEARSQIENLRNERDRYLATLELIKNQDYRGYPCTCSGIAKAAIERKAQ